MLRSDKMTFCEMYLQPEAAFDIMTRLGDMGCVQFSDLNPEIAPTMKKYMAEVCRCAELERKMRYVESEIRRDDMEIPEPSYIPPPMQLNEMSRCENDVDRWENDILDIASNETNLKQDLLEMKEMRYVLVTVGQLLGNADSGMERLITRSKQSSKMGDTGLSSHLYMLSGLLKRTRCFAFELMLWRVARGNIYYRQASYDEALEDPYTGTEIRKVAFLAFCQGEALSKRVQKIFSGFRVNVYPCPEDYEERMQLLHKIEGRIVDLQEVLDRAKFFRCKSLRVISRKWKAVMIRIRKAKAIYHNLNLFSMDISKNCLIGQCWIATRNLRIVQETLRIVSENTESNVESFLAVVKTDEQPPTVQRTNKFTYGFQMLINAYGESKYGEMNPGLYTIISFPFLFAIMFGDAGHAVIMILFASWMLIYEEDFLKQPGSEIWNIFFGGRYVSFLMGIFSLYTGFVYNDVFSRAMNFSKSMWGNVLFKHNMSAAAIIDIDHRYRLQKPYVFGLDPIWTISKNKIMIENSIKMKMSLVIGIIHMIFGIMVSIFNHIHFKKYYLVFLQFVPEIMFLICIFFWLVILIIYKWIYFYSGHSDTRYGCSCSPQILILFIDMMLLGSTAKKEPEKGCKTYLFDAQETIQPILVGIALAMVPILLLGPPCWENRLNKKKKLKLMNQLTTFRKYQPSDTAPDPAFQKKLAKCDVPFGELMIHQGVHTIEFVLSTISHTASYLRLWALSLAHSQLSEMLWMMILSKLALQQHNPAGVARIFVGFPVWALFTVAILVVMEGLSAFLHTLRLHWVEFMSKFFIGGGVLFKPFYFKDILALDIKTEGACTSSGLKRHDGKQGTENVELHKV